MAMTHVLSSLSAVGTPGTAGERAANLWAALSGSSARHEKLPFRLHLPALEEGAT
ncbi:MAG: hypothetical protein KTR33_12220 [Gammaproteobacteria bacterium]|nr:hypothetical protein [Gammaproteobacteria bacterium]